MKALPLQGTFATHPAFPGVTISIELINAERAIALLERNTLNRSIVDSAASRYSNVMLAGEWKLSPHGLGIANDGSIIDGQHRLWAVVLSNTQQYFIIVRGLAEDVRIFIDAHRPRSSIDTLKIQAPALTIRSEDIAVIKGFYSGLPKVSNQLGTWPSALIERGAEIVKPALDFMRLNLGMHTRNLTVAPVKTAVARAYFHCRTADMSGRLARFCRVLVTGETTDERELAVVKLRNILSGQSAKAKLLQGITYQYTQAAIRHVLAGNIIKYLRVLEEDVFPVTAEQALDVTQAKLPWRRTGRLNLLQRSLLAKNLSHDELDRVRLAVQGEIPLEEEVRETPAVTADLPKSTTNGNGKVPLRHREPWTDAEVLDMVRLCSAGDLRLSKEDMRAKAVELKRTEGAVEWMYRQITNDLPPGGSFQTSPRMREQIDRAIATFRGEGA